MVPTSAVFVLHRKLVVGRVAFCFAVKPAPRFSRFSRVAQRNAAMDNAYLVMTGRENKKQNIWGDRLVVDRVCRQCASAMMPRLPRYIKVRLGFGWAGLTYVLCKCLVFLCVLGDGYLILGGSWGLGLFPSRSSCLPLSLPPSLPSLVCLSALEEAHRSYQCFSVSTYQSTCPGAPLPAVPTCLRW